MGKFPKGGFFGVGRFGLRGKFFRGESVYHIEKNLSIRNRNKEKICTKIWSVFLHYMKNLN